MAGERTNSTPGDTAPELPPDGSRTVPDTSAASAAVTAPSAGKPAPKEGSKAKKVPAEPKDSFREVVETVVFVVVLVLMLKSFVAEAFVIPTGSMAETLYGYQKIVYCPECELKFPVNCSDEAEKGRASDAVRAAVCPSCRQEIGLETTHSNDLFKLLILVGGAFFGGLAATWVLGSVAHKHGTSSAAGLLVQVPATILVGVGLWLLMYGRSDARVIRQGTAHDQPVVATAINSGDRVLVAKFLYDSGVRQLQRFDVVVFKFPEEPQREHTPKNYIKRLIGLAGETIGILDGDLYVADNIPYDGPVEDEKHLDVRRQTRRDFPKAKDALMEGNGAFKILRKPPHVMLALQRLVYDNEHQARDLQKLLPPRWAPEKDFAAPDSASWNTVYLHKRELAAAEGAWKADGNGFRHAARSGDLAWLRYRHINPPDRPVQPRPGAACELIKDVLGYNNGISDRPRHGGLEWVGDLLLSCDVTVEQADGELVLELSKGVDRFQAVWQLAGGTCTLFRLHKDGRREEMSRKETTLKGPGKHHVRFANFDQRLTVWVDGKLPFGDGEMWEPAREVPGDPKSRPERGSYDRNDYEPVSIGVRGGAVAVNGLQVHRDTYYTQGPTTMYVQPGHYLCLGDNSAYSSDSRTWEAEEYALGGGRGGLVPKELMLGRAMLVYWPWNRFGVIK
jgi:signal peptidase I